MYIGEKGLHLQVVSICKTTVWNGGKKSPKTHSHPLPKLEYSKIQYQLGRLDVENLNP